MIVDANCAVGHWPFRRLWTTTAEGLLRLLDRAAIDRALVAHTHGVFYRDPHQSNAELYEAVRPHRDRLIPLACLNPDYAGWEDDLRQCVEEWGMAGLRLYPTYHRYDLAGDAAASLLAEAEGRRLPVSIGCAFEDPRQRHPMDTAPDVTEHQLGAAVRRFPQVRFLITNAPLATMEMVVHHTPQAGNAVFDTSAVTGPLAGTIERAYALLGPRRLLLGSHAPFKYPEVARLRLQFLDLDAATRAAVEGRNALDLAAFQGKR
ncbi:MAG TPA: amidohydrolase family protein [Chloroflexota bacterium]|nr:amidohydrolase family protein [Chloroflexota bacterium]